MIGQAVKHSHSCTSRTYTPSKQASYHPLLATCCLKHCRPSFTSASNSLEINSSKICLFSHFLSQQTPSGRVKSSLCLRCFRTRVHWLSLKSAARCSRNSIKWSWIQNHTDTLRSSHCQIKCTKYLSESRQKWGSLDPQSPCAPFGIQQAPSCEFWSTLPHEWLLPFYRYAFDKSDGRLPNPA